MIQRYLRTLDAVRRSYPEAKRLEEAGSDLPAALLYRPLSNWLAPLFLMAGWPADAVSALGIGLSLLWPCRYWIAPTGQSRGQAVDRAA
jgi:hypothetical protein